MYLADVFTVGANLAGLPAITVPCGFTADRLPVGLQFTGRAMDDATVLRVADAFERVTSWSSERPSIAPSSRFALTRVPDLPQWVDTRGMLLSGRARSSRRAGRDRAAGSSSSCRTPRWRRSSAVRPPAPSRRSSRRCSGDVNVLAQMEDADYVARALDGWQRRTAIIHVLPGLMPWEHGGRSAGARLHARRTRRASLTCRRRCGASCSTR